MSQTEVGLSKETIKVSKQTLEERLARGFTLEQATDPLFKKKYGYNRRVMPILHDGQVFRSIKKLSDYLGLTNTDLLYYLEKGVSPKGVVKKLNAKKIFYKGKEYRSVKELCISEGVNTDFVLRQRQKGKSLEDAISLYKDNRILIVHDGVEFRTKKEIAEYIGITQSALHLRLRQGVKLEDIFYPKQSKNVRNGRAGTKQSKTPLAVYKGVEFYKKKDIAEYLGIAPQSLSKRLKRGLTIDEVFYPKKEVASRGTKVRIKDGKISVGKYTFDGKKFHSKREVSRYYGIPYDKLLYRLKKGYTLEESVESVLYEND